MILQLAIFTLSIFLLYTGAQWLVDGADSLAKKIGLSPMLVGLTVVAFGTSAPELTISIVSSCGNQNMLAIGNIIGSNICNLTMVLGITALFKPVITDTTILKQEIPIMLSASACLFLMSLNSVINTSDGLILLTGTIAYIHFNYTKAKKTIRTVKTSYTSKSSYKKKPYYIKIQIITIIIGILSLIIGAKLLVYSAIKIMEALEISEKCIGLTIVAFGTSLPELATSIVAITRKQVDISIGNLVGSNIFNILSVIGITALIHPIKIEVGFVKSTLILDYIVMIFTSSLPLLLMQNNKTITRMKGLMLISLYISYIFTLFYKPL